MQWLQSSDSTSTLPPGLRRCFPQLLALFLEGYWDQITEPEWKVHISPLVWVTGSRMLWRPAPKCGEGPALLSTGCWHTSERWLPHKPPSLLCSVPVPDGKPQKGQVFVSLPLAHLVPSAFPSWAIIPALPGRGIRTWAADAQLPY